MSKRDHRVTLALKWHYLDNLTANEIRDRFEREGIGDYTTSTVRDYLNEEPKEAVIEQIEQQHANVRLQSAERFERLYQRACEAEAEASRDEQIIAMRPKMRTVSQEDGGFRVADWEVVPPGDGRRPEWADEHDVIVEFTDDTRYLEPGDEYPAGARQAGKPARPGTQPEYRKAVVGMDRDVDDPKAEAMARSEQAKYQREKGDVLGVYSTDINMTVDGDIDHSVELDAETAAAIREADLQRGDADE